MAAERKRGRVAAAVALWATAAVALQLLVGGEAATFMHLSDLHYDPLYVASANASSSCRIANATEVGAAATFTTAYGQYGCDAPEALVQSMLSSLNTGAVDFLIYTGDMAAHALPDQNHTLAAIGQVSDWLADAFVEAPVLAAVGNNDCFPDYTVALNGTLLAGIYDAWAPWIPADQEAIFKTAGCYSTLLTAGLRGISLNTVLYSLEHQPFTDAESDTDPGGQFAWLQAELDDVRANGELAYIAGHIPPGNDQYEMQEFWQNLYADHYLAIVTKYSDVVAGQFFGHLHRDDFRVFWQTPQHETASQFALLAPSVSPVTNTNPSYRLISYDPDTAVLQDYHEIYADLALTYVSGELSWQEEYSFSEAYGETLDRAGMAALYHNMQVDAVLFNAYLARRESQFSAQRWQYLCAVGSIDRRAYDVCLATFNTLGSLSDAAQRIL
eukprot:CAMPEP_0114623786 /NCGR_PEP_ID=MMETSP0168-20121206/10432_1 /TAXON_ID=95228 ORGANISM="Vannella sp., Strain DIVA3 517/6/12" /NCGR_SAMPLE_ID=MMETSP0168 /ASSEMBLY_ACC=CAM_ASM_000044 /LENGTH=441 /DNA_ID=CAMNT_0001835043 /DNA_START=1 /DNA_END=1326 /DNA_ORIENTATION=+